MLKEGFDKYIFFGAPDSNRLIPPQISIKLGQAGFYKARDLYSKETYTFIEELEKCVAVAISVKSQIPFAKVPVEVNMLYQESIRRIGEIERPEDQAFIHYVIYRMYKDLLFPNEAPLRTIEDTNYFINYEQIFMQDPAKVEYLVKVAELFEVKYKEYNEFTSVQIFEAYGKQVLQRNRELKRKVNTLIDTVGSLIPMRLLDEHQQRMEVKRFLTNSDEVIEDMLQSTKHVSDLKDVLNGMKEDNVICNELYEAVNVINETTLEKISKKTRDLESIVLGRWIKFLNEVVENHGNPNSSVYDWMHKDEEFPIRIMKSFPNIEMTLCIDLAKLNDFRDYAMSQGLYMDDIAVFSHFLMNVKTNPEQAFYPSLGIDVSDIQLDIKNVRNEAIRDWVGEIINIEKLLAEHRTWINYMEGIARVTLSINSLIFSKYYKCMRAV